MKLTTLAIRLEGKLEKLQSLGNSAAKFDRLLSTSVPDGELLQVILDGLDLLAAEERAFLEACSAFETLRESAESKDLATYQLARRQWTGLHDELRRLVPPAHRTTLAGDWAFLRGRLPEYFALKRELAAFGRRSLWWLLSSWGSSPWSASKPLLCSRCTNVGAKPRAEFDEGCTGCGRTARSIALEMEQLLGWSRTG